MPEIDWPEDLPPPYPVARLSVAEYQRILASKSLEPERRVEFLEGVIVHKSVGGLRHEGGIEKLVESIRPLLPRGWSVKTNCPFVTRESQPEPDVVVVSDKLQDADSMFPRATDVALVIEVADSTLTCDRRSKARIYARAAISSYWVLNLLDSQMEVFTNPSGPVPMPGYQEQRVYRIDDRLNVVIGMDDLGAIRVGDVIP